MVLLNDGHEANRVIDVMRSDQEGHDGEAGGQEQSSADDDESDVPIRSRVRGIDLHGVFTSSMSEPSRASKHSLVV